MKHFEIFFYDGLYIDSDIFIAAHALSKVSPCAQLQLQNPRHEPTILGYVCILCVSL